MAKWLSRNRLRQWILFTGDRYLIAASLLGLVAALFIFVGIGSVLNELSPLFYLYGGLVGGNITLITIVVSINQLVLLREFGTPGELRTEIRETTSYRQRATDRATIATQPPELLGGAIGQLQRGAHRIEPAGGNADNSLHRSLDQLRSSLLEHAERVDTRLSGDDSDLFDVVVAVLRARYGDRIQSVRRIQSVHEDALSSGLNDALDSIVMSLEDLDIARHYLLTIYVRHELSRLSRVLVYAEGVIESVTHEDAGSGNCVHEFPNPARGGFYPRVLQSRGYRDTRTVRAS